MANVQLPSIGITPGDIDNANLPQLQKIVKGLLNTTAILTEELTYLLNNLDTRNVNEIDGDILVTGTVTAGKIAAGAITADKIEAGAITAEKIDVDELSAISANLGHIKAGLIETVELIGSEIVGGTITGSTITTRNGGVGKGIVMNSGWADLEIYSGVSSVSNTFSIIDLANDAGIWFARDGRIDAGRNIRITAEGEVRINAPGGVFVNGVQIG